ncbi:DnaJ family molecular chaperone [Lentilitoribacter sp. Alg239-R112]|uniref:J domain-containing protein n=1 Tax=Lentilitoribacter sp. Alg239-R112 TaxID=2305987 RepID=UPI0013A6E6B7|nr:DnaJ family molecular chaperone [Lentilitoribacter sp. Alg239-R112]
MLSICKILEAVGEAAQSFVSQIVEAVRTVFEGDPETRRQVAFSVAVIALSAKMAKADGVVTQAEVSAFQEIFEIPQSEAKNVSKLYNLAKQDVAGYDVYARRLSGLCSSVVSNCALLEDVMDGLYHIAKADGVIHEHENVMLQHIGEIFGLDEERLAQIAARHVHPEGLDPFVVLGVTKSTPFDEIKRRYRELAKKSHPDNLRARGVPDEFMRIAGDRMAKLNLAFEAIERLQVRA